MTLMPQRRPLLGRRSLATLATLSLAVAASACQPGSEPASDQAASAPAEGTPAPPEFRPANGGAAAAPANEARGDARANHSVETSVSVAEDGSLALVTNITAANGYHLNTDPNFPWRVKVADDAPCAAGTTLGSRDAATLEEDAATFTIPVADPGDAENVPGEVVLGICDDQGCIRVREEVTWTVARR